MLGPITGGTSGGAPDYVSKTANFTFTDKIAIATDTSGGSFTGTALASPVVGQYFSAVDAFNTWDLNNFTIARNGQLIESTAADLVCDIRGVQVMLVFVGGSVGWRVLYQMAQATTASLPPNLPLWTFDAAQTGTPAAGFFQTDNTLQAFTGTLIFSATAKDGSNSWATAIASTFGTAMTVRMTNSNGKIGFFNSESFSVDSSGNLNANVGFEFNAGAGNTWVGDYQVLFDSHP